MCGIAGYINLNNKKVHDTSMILNMLRAQKHRGPDDSGVNAFNLISGKSSELPVREPVTVNEFFTGVMGFNRLSILDLSMNGHQPMISPDGNVILAFNGEVYNAFDFKQSLANDGYRFKSTTDTEVVLALYLKYGLKGMLTLLNGMFAIVIVDLHKHETYLARDRFGIKPMYYTYSEDLFAFSSELKSFKCLDDLSFILDEDKLDEFILFRNNIEDTLLKGVRSLNPGCFLTLRDGKEIVEDYYFKHENYTRLACPGGIPDFSDKLEQWLGQSVRSQLMSDVRLGCQLSGGIDSTLVTWLANKSSSRGNFEAVSIVFNEPEFSEENYIDQVSGHLGIDSHKFLLDADYYLDNIEDVTWHLEVPINHPNTVAIYKLSQSAKQYVTVLLSGEGADEVFGGYERFYFSSYPFRSRRMLHELKKGLRNPSSFFDYLKPGYRAILASAFISPGFAAELLPSFSFNKAVSKRYRLYRSFSGSLFDRQVKYEMTTYLPDLLIRQDKMSMAHSIENRVPFLDNDLVQNAFTIPEKFLLIRKSSEGYNNEKYLLKRVAARTFGNDFAFRSKSGFGIPVYDFFRNRRFKEYLNDSVIPGIRNRGIFNHTLCNNWAAAGRRLRYDEVEAMWVMVSFEIWASVYLDGNYENRNTSY